MKSQVFQSQSPTRWNSFVWAIRVVVVFVIIAIVSILFSLFRDSQYTQESLIAGEKRIQNINLNPQKKKVPESELISFASARARTSWAPCTKA